VVFPRRRSDQHKRGAHRPAPIAAPIVVPSMSCVVRGLTLMRGAVYRREVSELGVVGSGIGKYSRTDAPNADSTPPAPSTVNISIFS